MQSAYEPTPTEYHGMPGSLQVSKLGLAISGASAGDAKLKAKLEGMLDDMEHGKATSHGAFFESTGMCSTMKVSTTAIEDPSAEMHLASLELNSDQKLSAKAHQYLVMEDNVSELLKQGVHTRKALEAAMCKGGRLKPSQLGGMVQASAESDRVSYFVDERGCSGDDACAFALALVFYTGAGSDHASRGASLCVRKGNVRNAPGLDEAAEETAPLFFYLISALSQLPYYVGEVTRAVSLTDKELSAYAPGLVYTWCQFSSSKAGSTAPDHFAGRNVHFHIFSSTGRSISRWSSYADEEEVLFLPCSSFMVLGVVPSQTQPGRTDIYVRQIELGLWNKTVLWVDDHVMDESWENRGHMEHTSARQVGRNVHFVCKQTTELASAFLSSAVCRGMLKPRDHRLFRIATDMSRENEPDAANAGARLIGELIRQGYTKTPVLVFTSSVANATKRIKAVCGGVLPANVCVTVSASKAREFIAFQPWAGCLQAMR